MYFPNWNRIGWVLWRQEISNYQRNLLRLPCPALPGKEVQGNLRLTGQMGIPHSANKLVLTPWVRFCCSEIRFFVIMYNFSQLAKAFQPGREVQSISVLPKVTMLSLEWFLKNKTFDCIRQAPVLGITLSSLSSRIPFLKDFAYFAMFSILIISGNDRLLLVWDSVLFS